MKVLLVGNYIGARQQSMQRFVCLMERLLTEAGYVVTLVRPPVVFGRVVEAEHGIGKWLGYIDRFLVFPLLLRLRARSADIVHICDQANAMYVRFVREKPAVVTCHDTLAIQAARGEISGVKVGWAGRILQRWISASLGHAQLVACVSTRTEEELSRLCRINPNQIAVVPNALNFSYRPVSQSKTKLVLDKLGVVDRKYFFHVGGNQWYKNRCGVIEIFSHLRMLPRFSMHRLVMAGKPWTEEMRALVRRLRLEDEVCEVGTVSNEELQALYSGAEALLFPSLSEGFGWPIAEAQSCGCPVVTTNRAPMTEVGGTAAIYICPEDPSSAAAIIERGLLQRGDLRADGFKNVRRFTAKEMLRGYHESYSKAIAR